MEVKAGLTVYDGSLSNDLKSQKVASKLPRKPLQSPKREETPYNTWQRKTADCSRNPSVTELNQ